LRKFLEGLFTVCFVPFIFSCFHVDLAIFWVIRICCAFYLQASVQMQLVSEGNGVKFQLLRFTTPYPLDIIFLIWMELQE